MHRLPRSIRAFFLVIALSAMGLVAAVDSERREAVTFLEESENAFQGKYPFAPSVIKESITIGRLLTAQADPAFWNQDSIQDLSLYIVLKSRQHKISPMLVLSLIQVESRFRPSAISPKGAVGLMQLMPDTARWLAVGTGVPYHGPGALHDPKLNIELGLRYITHLRARFPSNEHMLTAYNIGPAALERKLKNGERLPLGYYRKVMEAMAVYRREARRPSDRSLGTWL